MELEDRGAPVTLDGTKNTPLGYYSPWYLLQFLAFDLGSSHSALSARFVPGCLDLRNHQSWRSKRFMDLD